MVVVVGPTQACPLGSDGDSGGSVGAWETYMRYTTARDPAGGTTRIDPGGIWAVWHLEKQQQVPRKGGKQQQEEDNGCQAGRAPLALIVLGLSHYGDTGRGPLRVRVSGPVRVTDTVCGRVGSVHCAAAVAAAAAAVAAAAVAVIRRRENA